MVLVAGNSKQMCMNCDIICTLEKWFSQQMEELNYLLQRMIPPKDMVLVVSKMTTVYLLPWFFESCSITERMKKNMETTS